MAASEARQVPTCTVIVVDEAYTSKPCGACGTIHQKLGGNQVFKWPHPKCGLVCDRDKPAARNILLRYLTTTNAGSVLRSETTLHPSL